MLTEATDQILAVVLWGHDADGEDDVAFMTGVLRMADGEYFVDRGDDLRFPLEAEWLPRIERTDPELLTVVDHAPFVLTLTVRNLDVIDDSYRPTGLKWPERPA